MNIKKIKTLRIDRSKWRTGDNSNNATGRGDTMLLNDEGFMCCLGFYCNQVGVKKDLFLDIGTPDDIRLDSDIPLLTKNLKNSPITRKAMDINDSSNKPIVRERQLRSLFKKQGVKVVIVGKYKKRDAEE